PVCLASSRFLPLLSFFFVTDTAPPEIYTLSLHDALPISGIQRLAPTTSSTTPRRWRPGTQIFRPRNSKKAGPSRARQICVPGRQDRKSTRLNSSHVEISYAVFCLKKKKRTTKTTLAHTQQ